MNIVMLSGRVGRPFKRNGNVGEFSLATKEAEKDERGQWIEVTEWHTVKVLGAAVCDAAEKFFVKGACLNVQGRLKTEQWTDADGCNHTWTKIYMQTWEFCPFTNRNQEGGHGI